jgi:serine O-acetyltransferase
MDDRGYVAQALFDRLHGDAVPFAVLGDSRGYPDAAPESIELAVPPGAFDELPRRIARFCHDFDLQLVQLLRDEQASWQFVIAWSDEVGRPRFLSCRVCSDYYRAGRRFLRAEELLAATPDVLFIHGLLDSVERQEFGEERMAWLGALWRQDPRAAIARIGSYWRRRREIRVLARAAKHGDWQTASAELPRLRRALHRSVWPDIAALPARLALGVRRLAEPAGALVAFVGAADPGPREQIARDLAPAFPAGVTLIERDHGAKHWDADLAVVFERPAQFHARVDELIEFESVPQVERAILRWLECRVEQRYPEALVGGNPAMARLLQFSIRRRIPILMGLMQTLLNCGIRCRIRSPILMPEPYGIVIHRNAVIGSRVTVMHQVTLGNKHPADDGAPAIEDNVFIGAGAKILGPVRVGRGATVGANAVVTRDVPSHCTVVGANRILGQGEPVAAQRRAEYESVVHR